MGKKFHITDGIEFLVRCAHRRDRASDMYIFFGSWKENERKALFTFTWVVHCTLRKPFEIHRELFTFFFSTDFFFASVISFQVSELLRSWLMNSTNVQRGCRPSFLFSFPNNVVIHFFNNYGKYISQFWETKHFKEDSAISFSFLRHRPYHINWFQRKTKAHDTQTVEWGSQ